MKDDMTESIIEGLRAGEVSIVGSTAEDGEFDFYIEDIYDTIELMTLNTKKKVLCWLSKQCKDYADRGISQISTSIPNDQVSLELFDAKKYDLDDVFNRTLEYYSMMDVIVVDCYGIIDYSKEKKSEKNSKAFQVFAKEIKIPILLFVPDT